MYKLLELNRESISEIYFSMGHLIPFLDPENLEVNLNFETARDALKTIDTNRKAMKVSPGLLLPSILSLVLYEIDLSTLPETVSQEIKDQIPDYILTQ